MSNLGNAALGSVASILKNNVAISVSFYVRSYFMNPRTDLPQILIVVSFVLRV